MKTFALPAMVIAVHTLSAMSEKTRVIVDTHVHNALLGRGLNYEFPATFPDLSGRNWTISDYTSSLPKDVSSEVVLMELAKSGDRSSQSLKEAYAYQQVAEECDRSHDCFVAGIVASAPVTSGAAVLSDFLPKLLKTAPLVRGIREEIWHGTHGKDDDAGWASNETYHEALRVLARHDVSHPP